jgi:hypothetical protein
MSEYQHYEWLALDRPLSEAQLQAAKKTKSRSA